MNTLRFGLMGGSVAGLFAWAGSDSVALGMLAGVFGLVFCIAIYQ